MSKKSNIWLMVISAGNPLYSIGGASHGDHDAQHFSKAFRQLPENHKFISVGQNATQAVVYSRWKSLLKQVQKDDQLILFYAGRQLATKSKTYLACWDTLLDDPATTAIDIAELATQMQKSKLGQALFLLDCSHQQRDWTVEEFSKLSILSACTVEEKAFTAGTPAAGIWTSLIIDAIAGKIPNAINQDGVVTLTSLIQFLQSEFKRKLRQQHGPTAQQNPQYILNFDSPQEEFPICFIGSDGNRISNDQLKQIFLRGSWQTKIRDLSGYRKSMQLPDRASPSSNKFFAKLAIDEIKSELDEVFQAIIHSFGFKRKDVHTNIDRDGFGTIRTPEFEYSLSIQIDSDDPTLMRWQREVSQLADVSVISSPAFEEAFSTRLNEIVFVFEQAREIEKFIDDFEENPKKGVRLRADPNGERCELRIEGFAGVVEMDRQQMSLKGKPGQLNKLIEMMSTLNV